MLSQRQALSNKIIRLFVTLDKGLVWKDVESRTTKDVMVPYKFCEAIVNEYFENMPLPKQDQDITNDEQALIEKIEWEYNHPGWLYHERFMTHDEREFSRLFTSGKYILVNGRGGYAFVEHN